MCRTNRAFSFLFLRYGTIFLVSLGNLYIFHALLTAPTVKAVAVALSPFYKVTVAGTFIYVKGVTTQIARSCVAASAYYLLFLLTWSTAEIQPRKRLYALLISFSSLFILNIARMVFLVSIIEKPYFDTVHWILQNLTSVVAVVAIWITVTHLLKIKTLPFYSDLKYIYSLTRTKESKD